MPHTNREDIHIISRHSNWKKESVADALAENVYSNSGTWKKFLKLFLLSLGVLFTVAGIVFFFAFNWANLNKFAKIGIVEGLIAVVTVLAVIPKFSPIIRNILLTGASVLVGVLFAVFGQIYQTGANAYDFFLVWTICITLWVLVSNFAPLWLLWLALVNTVVVLYTMQVTRSWNENDLLTMLTVVNAVALLSALFLNWSKSRIPTWFTNTIALAVVSCATIGICLGIFSNYRGSFFILLVITMILYTAGTIYGIMKRRAFYLSIIPFSVIVIISALIIKISDDQWMFLLVSLFIVASITMLIMKLMDVQKKWSYEAGK